MKKGFINIIFIFLILVSVSGCATTGASYGNNMAEEESLDVAPYLRFDDMPVPSGFRILEKESFAFQNDATRIALLKYVGTKTPDQVVAFYKDQMPLYSWNPINIIEYERRVLNYEKGLEASIVTIESEGRKSTIIIAISPKSKPIKTESKTESRK